jgi:hypothetical protein
MSEVKCICTAEYCGHSEGICGKPVSVILKMQVMLGPSEFSKPVETGICEACYATGQKVIPWAFPKTTKPK